VIGKLGWAVLLSFSSFCFANGKTFDLKMDLSMGGKHLASPRILVKEGEKALVSQEKNGEMSFIEVVAVEERSPKGDGGIRLDFVIGKIAADGSRTMVSQPRLLAYPGEKSQITVSNDDSGSTFSLSVIANHKDL
jgi:hypothetical protein